jgi:hypothetical protein
MNCRESTPTTTESVFLDLLRRRREVVETIIGPSGEDDAPRLEKAGDLEWAMIASPPRTPDEIAEALALVRSEIADGFLQTDTIEDFLGAMVDAAIGYIKGREGHPG